MHVRPPVFVRRLVLVLVFVLVLVSTAVDSAFAEGRDPIRLSPSSRRFALDDQMLWAKKGELLKVLRSQLRQEPLGIVDVLSEANRAAKERSGRVRLFRDKKKKEKKKRTYRAEHSFVWDRDDRLTTSWYPQGLTGSADAVAGGVLGDRRVLLVSWYARKNPEKGARISLVDVAAGGAGGVRRRSYISKCSHPRWRDRLVQELPVRGRYRLGGAGVRH